jgi:hypothetical protein
MITSASSDAVLKHCKFGHDYELSDEELEEMRNNALRAPCRFINDSECLLSPVSSTTIIC